MAEQTDLNELPQAAVTPARRTRISVVWIIPILAAVVAIGIAVQRVLSEGPTITIVFAAAQGIEAGKTFIKYKDVSVGQVTAVELSEDYAKVMVTAKIAKSAEGLMVEDAKFWVVAPRISLSGVTGLSTLLSGNYIGFEAGKSTEKRRSFVGLDQPPAVPDQRGTRFVLTASSLGSLSVGSPVYYRRISVGQVAAYELAADGRSVAITVFIEKPYDKYVTPATRFWNASGIEFSAGVNGVDVRTESLAALIAGGVAFDAPDFLSPVGATDGNTRFTLYSSREIAMKQPDPVERRYVLHFNESVRGLAVGAPVTLYGLRVGEVTDVGLSFDLKTLVFQPRVLITFFPDRLVAQLGARQRVVTGKALNEITEEERLRLVRRVIEDRGLRAQLRTGSYLTGDLYVAFEYFPDAPRVKLDWSHEPLELPVVPGGLANIEKKLTSILNKVDAMPLDAIAADVRSAIATFNKALKDTDTLVNRIDMQWVPEGTKTLEVLHRAIADADRVLLNVDATYISKDSPASQDLRDVLQEVTRAARAVRILFDYLERHPEMLIRGKPEGTP